MTKKVEWTLPKGKLSHDLTSDGRCTYKHNFLPLFGENCQADVEKLQRVSALIWSSYRLVSRFRLESTMSANRY